MTKRALAERHIEASNRFAIDEVEALVTEDVIIDMSRSIGPAQGVYCGVADARGFAEQYIEAFESVIAEPLDFYERGNWMAVAVRVRVRGRGSGVDVEAHGARVYEFRGDRIARYVQFQDMDEARAYVDAQP